MRVAQVSFFADPLRRDPERLLEEWPTVPQLAKAVTTAGARVGVVQASLEEAQFSRDGIDFHFVAPGSRLTARLRALSPEVFHVHGLGFGRDVTSLRATCPGRPILLQDQADKPPRFWRRRWWLRQAASIDGVFFCSRSQALPFVHSGVLSADTPVFEVAGTCVRFTPGPQALARAASGMHGSPAVLFVGHLNANKDPKTLLDAIATAVSEAPGIQAWLCFGTAPLLSDIERRIAGDARLQGRVHLMGRRPHAEVQELMRAADVLVLASHREGGSFALMEAMACGLPVAASDIPSSRALLGGTADGAGLLWPVGDAAALSRCLRELAARPAGEQRLRTRARFDAEHSLEAVGRKLVAAYQRVLVPGAATRAAIASGQS